MHLKSNLNIYVFLLWLLYGLFVLRVFAQLLQYKLGIPYLPPFDVWQSGAVSYKYLLVSQILIILFYGYICYQFSFGNVNPCKLTGVIYLVIGGVYFCCMLARLLIGQLLTEHSWFHAYLPILFHFVLSSFLVVVGILHLNYQKLNEQQ